MSQLPSESVNRFPASVVELVVQVSMLVPKGEDRRKERRERARGSTDLGRYMTEDFSTRGIEELSGGDSREFVLRAG